MSLLFLLNILNLLPVCWATPLLHEEDFFSTASVYEKREILENICQMSQNDPKQELLWKIYFFSRFGAIEEDPDIFERSLDCIIKNISAEQELSSNLPHLLHQSMLGYLQNHWKRRYPDILTEDWFRDNRSIPPSIRAQYQEMITKHWQQYGISWLEAFRSTKSELAGDLFRWLLFQEMQQWQQQDNSTLWSELRMIWGIQSPIFSFVPPEQNSGQYQDIAPPSRPSLEPTHFRQTVRLPSHSIIIFGCLIFIFLFRQYRFSRIIFGVLLLLLSDFILSISQKSLIKTKPFFQFNNWKIELWKEHERYYETQGSYVRAQRIRKEKTKKRLIILGASSAHGSNYVSKESFAGRLEEKYPIEVINLAIGGTTSHGILHLLPKIKILEPDAIILFYGHNEVHQFSQLQEFQHHSPTTLWVKNILWRSSLYSTLYRLLNIKTTTTIPQYTELPSNSHEQIVQLAQWNHFQNISIILEDFQEQEIPVFLLNPPTNYPFAPVDEKFITEPANTIAQKQQQIDQSHDATTIHSVIRKNNYTLAKRYGTYYIDLDEYFHKTSIDAFSANELFWDELHPSAMGHQWIAEILYPFVEAELISPVD